jgi:hypothetical protein
VTAKEEQGSNTKRSRPTTIAKGGAGQYQERRVRSSTHKYITNRSIHPSTTGGISLQKTTSK